MNESYIWNYIYSKEINKDDMYDQGKWLEKYNKYVQSFSEDVFLDLGCGEGANALYYRNLGYNVVASDFSQVVLERIKHRYPDINVKKFDMREGIPYEENSIGVIVASLSIHYFDIEQTKAIIQDIYRCLKPEGYFIYRVNNYREFERNKDNILSCIEEDYYKTKNGKKKRYFSVDSMGRLLADNFQVIQNFDTELVFNGTQKFAVEGIASKIIHK